MSGILSQDSISLKRKPPAGVRFCNLATPCGEKAGTQGAKIGATLLSQQELRRGNRYGARRPRALKLFGLSVVTSLSLDTLCEGGGVHCRTPPSPVRGLLCPVVTDDPLDCRYSTL